MVGTEVARAATATESRRLSLRLATLALVVTCLGLPVDNLLPYALLVAAVLAVFTGAIVTNARRWFGAAAIAALVVVAHFTSLAPRIEEGENVFLPGPAIGQTSGLPADVLRVASEQFSREYPVGRCASPAAGEPLAGARDGHPGTPAGVYREGAPCWRPERSRGDDGFAFSANSPWGWPDYSRRVGGIDFSDPADLRLGFINDHRYNWPDDTGDIERFERDRRSVNLLHRYRVTFPLFVMFRFPAAFVGSTLCWHGSVLWQEADDAFTLGAERACRMLMPEDAGRRIVALSIRRDVQLAMTLHPSATIRFRRCIEQGAMIGGVLAILMLLIRLDMRRLAVPAMLVGLALTVTVFVDASFIGGFRPLDGGDDGIDLRRLWQRYLAPSAGRRIRPALIGDEPAYYFTPGFRYVRALELAVFGDTFLLYLSAVLLLGVLAFLLFRRFLSARWTVVMGFGFVATPIGALFGSSLFEYVNCAARGFADPFAFVLLIGGLLLVLPSHGGGNAPGRWRIFAAGLLLAAATFCRPNLVLAAGGAVVGAAAIWVRTTGRRDRAAALAAGFSALALAPLHNLIFGHAFVLFSDNVNQPQTLLMSPFDYARAAAELVTFNFSGPHLAGAVAQIGRWLSGPEHLLATAPINAAAIAVLVRVGIFGTRFDPWLRVVALATLLQHGIGVSYVDYQRYTLGTWFLTSLVTAAWFEREGAALLAQAFPRVCKSCQRHPAVRRSAALIAAAVAWFRLEEAAPVPAHAAPTPRHDYGRTPTWTG